MKLDRTLCAAFLAAVLAAASGCARKPSPSAEERALISEAAAALVPPADQQPPEPLPAGPTAPIEMLRDQNDKAFLQRPGTRTTVMLMVNSAWREEASRWSASLLEVLPPECQVVHVLDLQDKSPVMAKMIQAGVRVSVGAEDVHVFMDWEGRVVKGYGIPVDQPAVIALDEGLKPLKVMVGPWSPDRAAEIAAVYQGK